MNRSNISLDKQVMDFETKIKKNMGTFTAYLLKMYVNGGERPLALVMIAELVTGVSLTPTINRDNDELD